LTWPFKIHHITRIERELLLIQTALDSLDEELTTDDIMMRERAMDKEFIILIQAACKADNIPRAVELVKLLHQLTSFDAAMKIADFYHLVGFREKVDILKTDRENNQDRLVLARSKRKRWLKPDPPMREVQGFNNSSSSRLDPLGDVRPPPTIERPGMTRVTVPVIEQTRFSSKAPPMVLPMSREETPFTEPPTPSEGKRKRIDVDDFDDSSFPMAPPPVKQSKCFICLLAISICSTSLSTFRIQPICTESGARNITKSVRPKS
jgi:chromosome transmission fidelity protein 4